LNFRVRMSLKGALRQGKGPVGSLLK